MEPRVLTLPDGVELYFDARGGDRCLRVSWHHGGEQLVLSLWREDTCVGTARLSRHEAARLIGTLATGLADSGPVVADDTQPRRAESA